MGNSAGTDRLLSRDGVHSAMRELESEFARYTLLKDYLEGKSSVLRALYICTLLPILILHFFSSLFATI